MDSRHSSLRSFRAKSRNLAQRWWPVSRLRSKRTGDLVLALALAACSGPETRVRDGLLKAGASPKLADCMAKRMVDRLSYAQLQRLSTLAKSDGEHGRKHLLKRVRDLDDPEIVSVVTTSAALCSTGFG